MSDKRFAIAWAATVVLALLAMAAVPYADPWFPVGFAIGVAVGLAWAIAVRRFVISGALAGLLLYALVPPLDAPNIGQMVMLMVAGATGGALWDMTVRRRA
jgi:hypothetical protein